MPKKSYYPLRKEMTEFKKLVESGNFGGGGSANLTNYYNKGEVDNKISDVSAAVASTGAEIQKNMTDLTNNVNGVKNLLLQNDDKMLSAILETQGKIPTDASETNKLASQEFVNNAVKNAAARAISSDALGNGFESYEALQKGKWYSLGVETEPAKNDYAVVKKDANHNNNDVRYNYDGVVWVFFQEFVSGAGFMPTTAQQNALDSGITQNLTNQISTNATLILKFQSQLVQMKTDLLANIATESTTRDTQINNVLVKITEEATARSQTDNNLTARVAALENANIGWYEFHFTEQTLILSSSADKTFNVSTNIPISDLELEYSEQGKSTITMNDSGTWTYHFVDGSTNAAQVLLKQKSNKNIIGRFYLNTSQNGGVKSPTINYFSPKAN